MALNVYSKAQNLCLGSTKMCMIITEHILVKSQKTKNRQYFYIVYSKDILPHIPGGVLS
jgi:hypothetical protein